MACASTVSPIEIFAADEVGRHARRAAEDAQQTAAAMRDKGAELYDTVREKGAEFVDAARQRGQEYTETMRERGHEYGERARDEARRIYREGKRGAGEVAAHAEEYYDEVSGMVRRNPAQALGIAAGVGFLLGLIIARR